MTTTTVPNTMPPEPTTTTTDAPVLLHVRDLTKVYPGRTQPAVADVSFDVAAGQVVGLLGPNGSGKTTTLGIVVGLSSATSGHVVTNHTGPGAPIGFVPDDLPMPDLLTGREFLALITTLDGAEAVVEADRAAQALGIGHALDHLVGEYSHGMRKRLQLAAAVMSRPSVLVLDEPFSGLDPAAALGLRRMLTDWARSGRSVLLSTHDLLLAEVVCDWVVIIAEGHLVAAGRPQSLLLSSGTANLEEAFCSFAGLAPDVTTSAFRSLLED